MNSLLKASRSLLSLTNVTDEAAPIPFTEGMQLYWDVEATLQEAFDLRTHEGRACYAAWLLVYQDDLPGLYITHHASLYPAFAESVKQPVLPSNETALIPALICAIWKTHSDLREAFDLTTEIDRTSLCGNLLLRCHHKFSLVWILHDYLAAPLPEAGGLPRVLYAIWLTRSDLQEAFDITQESDRTGFLGNLLLNWKELPLLSLPIQDYLAAPVPEADNLPRVLYAIWRTRADLQQHFSLGEPGVGPKILLWAKLYGCREYSWLGELLDHSGVSSVENKLLPISGTPEPLTHSTLPLECAGIVSLGKKRDTSYVSVDTVALPHGVNLFGFPFAPSGLGMDLRMVATALDHAQIPFCVINCPMPTPAHTSELAFSTYQSDKPIYDTTLFCLPCGEIFRAMCMLGEDYFSGQYCIGQMPWEFACWPPTQVPILNLLHEAWSLSEFIKNALVPVCQIPITPVLRPVVYEPQSEVDRATFGMTGDVYIFLFMWDGLSYSSRKNPFAIVRAFGEAFAPSVSDVRLILKTQHSFYDKHYKELTSLIAADDRIQVIEGDLTQKQVWGLYTACDVYVALHRSEGFGLSLAEAMLAERPVIASAYSGNLDFCTHETSLLVSGRMVSVPPGAYPLAEGQEWFDADVNEAAKYMRYCYEHRQEVATQARAGRDFIHKHYSIPVAAKCYETRLRQIWKQRSRDDI